MVTRAEDGSVYYYKKAGVNMQQIGNVHEFGPCLTRERVRSSVPWPDLELFFLATCVSSVFSTHDMYVFQYRTCCRSSILHSNVEPWSRKKPRQRFQDFWFAMTPWYFFSCQETMETAWDLPKERCEAWPVWSLFHFVANFICILSMQLQKAWFYTALMDRNLTVLTMPSNWA